MCVITLPKRLFLNKCHRVFGLGIIIFGSIYLISHNNCDHPTVLRDSSSKEGIS